MGWTGVHKARGVKIDTFFSDFWKGSKTRWLSKGYLVNGREYYRPAINEDGEAFAVVMLIDYDRNSFCNFLYKDMDETMGPYCYNAPVKMLDLLDSYGEPRNEEAKRWRQACRDRAARKAAVIDGAILKFPREIEFTDGAVSDKMVVVEVHSCGRYGRRSKKIRFDLPGGAHVGRYHIRGWENMNYEVVGMAV